MIPSVLEVSIGGYMGPSFRISLDHQEILYSSFTAGFELAREAIITPSDEHWFEFLKTIDHIGVWNWKSEYRNRLEIIDGTQWKLEIQYGDKQISVHGDNAYPPDFDQVIDAIRKLIVGLPFEIRP